MRTGRTGEARLHCCARVNPQEAQLLFVGRVASCSGHLLAQLALCLVALRAKARLQCVKMMLNTEGRQSCECADGASKQGSLCYRRGLSTNNIMHVSQAGQQDHRATAPRLQHHLWRCFLHKPVTALHVSPAQQAAHLGHNRQEFGPRLVGEDALERALVARRPAQPAPLSPGPHGRDTLSLLRGCKQVPPNAVAWKPKVENGL